MSTQQQWDTQSNLLLVQLIYKYGDPYTQSTTSSTQKDTTFENIAAQLTQHSLIRPSKRKFAANLCEQHYIDLLAQEGLTRELSLPTSAAANKKPSLAVATLVQRLYITHITYIKNQIKNLETEFLNTHKEIEEIESGKWDEKFAKEIEATDGIATEALAGTEARAVEVAVTPKEDVVATPASTGTKRRRGGRRGGSVASTPAAETVVNETEEVDEEEPPAKRSRLGTEEVAVEEAGEEKVEHPVAEDVEMEDVQVEKAEQPETEEPEVVEEITAETKEVAEEQSEEEEEEKEEEAQSAEIEEPVAEGEEVPEQVDEEDKGEETEDEIPETKVKSETPAPQEQQNPSTSPMATKLLSSEPESDAEATPSRPPKSKPFPILIQPLHAGLSSLKSATLFSHPIREIDAPNYSNLIRFPTDLKTIWKQVKDGRITESRVYHREVMRMFANAVMYNTAVWEMTTAMAKEGDKLCEEYRRSENFGNGGGRARKRK